MPDTGEEPVYLAKLAEHAEQYEGMSLLLFIYALPFTHETHRDGRKHETCRLIQPRTHSWGAKFPFCRLQECYQRRPCLLAYSLLIKQKEESKATSSKSRWSTDTSRRLSLNSLKSARTSSMCSTGTSSPMPLVTRARCSTTKCLSSLPLYYVIVLISRVCRMVVYDISLAWTWVFLPPLIHTLLRIHSFLCTLKLSM